MLTNIDQQFAQTKAPVGFIEALAMGQYDASEPTIKAARHYLPQILSALSVIERHVQDMEKALRDFADHGTRFDCNPTVMVHGDNEEWMRIHSWWVGRAHDMDAGVRRRARAALPARSDTQENA